MHIDFAKLIRRYFRRASDSECQANLEHFGKLRGAARNRFIQRCTLPCVLDKIHELGDAEIRTEIEATEYYRTIGQFADVLTFEKVERVLFARHDNQQNLLALLLFDRDPEVLNTAAFNPALPISALEEIDAGLQNRGIGIEDDVYLRIVKEALDYKRNLQNKTASIESDILYPEKPGRLLITLKHLLDDDLEVIKFALYALNRVNYASFERVIMAEKAPPGSSVGNYILFILRLDYRFREIFAGHYQEQGSGLGRTFSIDNPSIFGKAFDAMRTPIEQLFSRRRQQIMQKFLQMTDNEQSLLCLVYLFIAGENKERLRTEMSKRRLFARLAATTSSRAFVREALSVLNKSDDEEIGKRVQEIYLGEAQYLMTKLKSTEIAVQAYFDIIFQSLAIPQINAVRETGQKLLETKEVMDRLLAEVPDDESGPHHVDMAFARVSELLEYKIKNLNELFDDRIESELIGIVGMLDQVLVLREYDSADKALPLRPGDEEKYSKKIEAIWRSSLTTYLGRIKELAEMLAAKVAGLHRRGQISAKLRQKLERQVFDLEANHKESVQCKLTIRCATCVKRGCSAERFLRECLFWSESLLRIPK
jgi:hypothetical protein